LNAKRDVIEALANYLSEPANPEGIVRLYLPRWRGPWRGWAVCFTRRRCQLGGQMVAAFTGRFARLRAYHRAAQLERRWRMSGRI
jgi:hypothetical protein